MHAYQVSVFLDAVPDNKSSENMASNPGGICQRILKNCADEHGLLCSGLAMEAAQDSMESGHPQQRASRSHESVPAERAESVQLAASASHSQLDAMPLPPVHLPTAVSLDLDRVPSPSMDLEEQETL